MINKKQVYIVVVPVGVMERVEVENLNHTVAQYNTKTNALYEVVKGIVGLRVFNEINIFTIDEFIEQVNSQEIDDLRESWVGYINW